jgi:hypothetical protein
MQGAARTRGAASVLILLAILLGAGLGCSLDLDYLRAGNARGGGAGATGSAAGATGGAAGSLGEGGSAGSTDDAGLDTGVRGPSDLDAEADAFDGWDGKPPRIPTGIAFGLTHQSATLSPSQGGTSYADTCQPDGVVVGVEGTEEPASGTTAPRSLQVICGQLSVNGTGPFQVTWSFKEALPIRGNFPGTMMEGGVCPSNQVVVSVDTRAGMWVDQLAFHCAELQISGGPETYTLSVVPSGTFAPIGGLGGSPTLPITCGTGEVVTGTYLRAGDAIDAFSFGCAPVSLEYAP